MRIAVIIPYHPKADRGVLAWTLEGYGRQVLSSHTLAVYLGVDGAESCQLERLKGPTLASRHPVSWHAYPRMGAAAVRNALVTQVHPDTELLIFGNADARPDDDMVERHAATMANLPPHALVLGAAPWERVNPTVIDALIDDTPMIFSYCHAVAEHWYPFRIAYSLNLSVRHADFVAAGGFPEEIRPYYYEDLAFGCRVLGPERAGLYYQPAARVLHRHPMTFDQYLDREELLGLMAPVLARICPEAFSVLMAGRSVDAIARDFREKLAGDASIYRRIYDRIQDHLAKPAETLGHGAARKQAIEALYRLHIPVKLLAFRLGFLKGIDLVEDQHWQRREPTGLWRTKIER